MGYWRVLNAVGEGRREEGGKEMKQKGKIGGKGGRVSEKRRGGGITSKW